MTHEPRKPLPTHPRPPHPIETEEGDVHWAVLPAIVVVVALVIIGLVSAFAVRSERRVPYIDRVNAACVGHGGVDKAPADTYVVVCRDGHAGTAR